MENQRYVAFGLSIESSIDFSNHLPICKHNADVVITECDRLVVQNSQPTNLYRRGIQAQISGVGIDVTLYWEGVGVFRIEGGVRISYRNLGADEGTLQLFLLSEVIGIILFQRGCLVLHGSAIQNKGEGATVFVGAAGSGKSTTAAALANRGNTVLTDDLVAIAFQNGTPVIIPAFNQLKLWQKSVNGLGLDTSRLQPSFEGSTKYLVKQSLDNFPDYTIPLSSIWCSDGREKEPKSLPQSEAYMQLLKNFALPGSLLANSEHFTQIVQVVKNVQVKGKPTHTNFKDLEDWIVEHSIGD